MRGDVVYRVYGVHTGRPEDVFFDAFRTRQEAVNQVEELQAREMNGRNWAAQYHDKGFVIREVVVETDFEIPPPQRPREKYVVRVTPKENRPAWNTSLVDVCRRDDSMRLCGYERNHAMFQTFEPFRQRGHEFALISRDYTRSAVLDLSRGEVIAEEPDAEAGFCPAGFYVPDWWDVHDGRIIPGSEHWNGDEEWPVGDFGFVWGCVWGDDSSWKIQYLDLTDVRKGVLRREERFGYVKLATDGYLSPCFDLEKLPKISIPPFIRVWRERGLTRVTFSVQTVFDLATGKKSDPDS